MEILASFWNNADQVEQLKTVFKVLSIFLIFLGGFIELFEYIRRRLQKEPTSPKLIGIIIIFVGGVFVLGEIYLDKHQIDLAQKFKRTAPEMSIDLIILDIRRNKPNNRTFRLSIEPKNEVPFEFKWKLLTTKNKYINPTIQLDWSKVYPNSKIKYWYEDKIIDINGVIDDYVQLKFDYKSIYLAELNMPELKDTIIKQYTLSKDKKKLIKK